MTFEVKEYSQWCDMADGIIANAINHHIGTSPLTWISKNINNATDVFLVDNQATVVI